MKNIDSNQETQDLRTPKEKHSINHFKTAEGKRSFMTRLWSTIVMLILLVLYISAGAVYTYKQDLPLIEIAAYASYLGTFFIIIFATIEMNKATGFKKWWQHLIINCLVLLAFLYPITTNLYQFHFYLHFGRTLNTIAQPWIFVLIVILISFVFICLGILDKNIGLQKALINYLMMLVLVIGFKGFTITSLSLFGSPPYETRLSFNTIVWIWLMIIFGDTFAYIGGMAWGKTKLAPKISPKKPERVLLLDYQLLLLVD
ncbi:phosphatidate cytidylyltransferase [Spiroplasma clarkii]|uniref:phosphatidate cytidylyltransferase n=1 Tax=Spiroplasma clarkii TaxID=2139 RepID=UPI000B569284|nr:phosphatidate cytidylyltransferase [Spiroplasma clarkii]ARU91444.1 phosphatidate cytidylyltransferase [Spiroplasma clarkii]